MYHRDDVASKFCSVELVADCAVVLATAAPNLRCVDVDRSAASGRALPTLAGLALVASHKDRSAASGRALPTLAGLALVASHRDRSAVSGRALPSYRPFTVTVGLDVGSTQDAATAIQSDGLSHVEAGYPILVLLRRVRIVHLPTEKVALCEAMTQRVNLAIPHLDIFGITWPRPR